MLSFRRAIAAQDDFDVKKSKNIPKRDSEYVDCDVHPMSGSQGLPTEEKLPVLH